MLTGLTLTPLNMRPIFAVPRSLTATLHLTPSPGLSYLTRSCPGLASAPPTRMPTPCPRGRQLPDRRAPPTMITADGWSPPGAKLPSSVSPTSSAAALVSPCSLPPPYYPCGPLVLRSTMPRSPPRLCIPRRLSTLIPLRRVSNYPCSSFWHLLLHSSSFRRTSCGRVHPLSFRSLPITDLITFCR